MTAKTAQILLGMFCHSCGRFSTSSIIQIANTILNFYGSNTRMDELNYYFYKIAFFIVFVNDLLLLSFPRYIPDFSAHRAGCCDPVDHAQHGPKRSVDLEPMTSRLKVRDVLYPLGSPT